MWNDFFNSLSLIDFSGYIIIGVILLTLLLAFLVNLTVRGRYAFIERDLRQNMRTGKPLKHRLLTRLVREATPMLGHSASDTNFQALIEHRIKQDMGGALLAERFLKAAAGLMIVLGLVGTFYGLTLSIGKLVTLISGDVSGVAEITDSLTKGLAGALSGMSVAFSTSLVGIVSAIIVILLGIVSNLADRRAAFMLQLEVHLDTLHREALQNVGGMPGLGDGHIPLPPTDARTVQAIESLGMCVGALQESVATFDAALKEFSNNTRDFQEFNYHLKDNIQRMSIGFADFSEAMKRQVAMLKNNRMR